MLYQTITRLCAGFALTATLVLTSALPGQAASLTQRDWMVALTDTLGWSFGLPDQPDAPDYINILQGNRTYRFEAEDIHSRDEDFVTLMSFRNFGSFSGSGWLHGGREPVLVHLRFTLPLTGEYRLETRVRGAGHRFVISGKEAEVDAGDEFTDLEVGSFQLSAGPQEILVTLPPNGSIDFISLSAPNLAKVEPLGGWQPGETLTWDTVHATLVQLLGLAELFPAEAPPLVIEAEDLPQSDIETVTIPYLGVPSAGKWLRAGPHPAKISLSLPLPASGFYDLTLRAMGDPLQVTLDDHLALTRAGGAYLDDHRFKPLAMSPRSSITLEIPPGGGVDQLLLTRRQVDAAGTSRLLGLAPSAAPDAAALDILTRLLAAFGVER